MEEGKPLDTYTFLIHLLNYWDSKRLDPKTDRTFEQTVIGVDALREVRAAKAEDRPIRLTDEQYKLCVEPTLKEFVVRQYGFHAVAIKSQYDAAVTEEK